MQKKLTYFYLIPLTLLFMANCVFSLLETTYFSPYMHIELPEYKSDHPLVMLCLFSALLLLMLPFCRHLENSRISLRGSTFLSCLWAGALSTFFVFVFRCGVVCDSEQVSDIAVQVMQGNYEGFAKGAYLHHYPFQLGLVAILELVYRLFGVENFLAFQLLNVIAILCIVYFLQKITRELFDSRIISLWENLISLGMLPLYLFAAFVYGDLIGLAFGMGAVYLGIRYLKTSRWQYLPGTAALFSLAVIAKSNIYVLLAAFIIAMVLKMLQERRWSILPWLIGILLLSQAGMSAVNSVYADRAGMERMWNGTPKTAWIAMSIQRADESANGCGWYNGYNWNIYEQYDFNNETVNRECLRNIGESLKDFAADPKYAAHFFYRKFTSQWNAPTFQSLITNEWYGRYSEDKLPLADFLSVGNGRRILYQVMNFYHLFLFAGCTMGLVSLVRSWSLEKAYFALNIFGGVLFHMLWEAQSRYVLGYYVMMLPLAASGYFTLFKYLRKKRA